VWVKVNLTHPLFTLPVLHSDELNNTNQIWLVVENLFLLAFCSIFDHINTFLFPQLSSLKLSLCHCKSNMWQSLWVAGSAIGFPLHMTNPSQLMFSNVAIILVLYLNYLTFPIVSL
jgi:hypothetical protein